MDEKSEISFAGDRALWRIRNFISSENDTYERSPNFKFKNCIWYFTAETKIVLPRDVYVTLSIWKLHSNEIKYRCRVGIETDTDTDIISTWLDSTIPSFTFDATTFKETFDNQLSVFCEFRQHCEPVRRIQPSTSSRLEFSYSEEETAEPKLSTSKDSKKMIETLKVFLETGLGSDVILKVGDKEFKVHKFILRRSPVFSAMLSHHMSEKLTGVIQVIDCDEDSFSDFLLHLYTGHLENMSIQKALHLYQTAHKYEVQELKEECVEYMKTNISVERFIDTLTLSHKYEELELIGCVTEFFLLNARDIVVRSEWEKFLVEYPIPANNLIIELSKKSIY